MIKTDSKVPPQTGEERDRIPEELKRRAKRRPQNERDNPESEEATTRDDDTESCDGNNQS